MDETHEWRVFHLLELVIIHNRSTHEQNMEIIGDITPSCMISCVIIEKF